MNYLKSSLSLLCLFCFSIVQANVNSYFNQIKKDPNALYAFFKKMPKGGELHYHLSGGAYPETMLALASIGHYCLNKETLTLKPYRYFCDGVSTKGLLEDQTLYNKLLDDWSFKDFIPVKESRHDHFFNPFFKFNALVADYRPELLASVIQRAAEQQEHYLEIMIDTDDAKSTSFGHLVKDLPTFEQKKESLLQNPEFQKNINYTIAKTHQNLEQARQYLACKTNPQAPACKISVKFLVYVLREQTLDEVFAQALNAFESASHSQGEIPGVNLVQAEDGPIALGDYHKQMLIFQYLHHIYPKVHIALHAGELAPQSVSPNNVASHIHDALFTGQAQRIGHGATIAYEFDPESSLKYMAKNQIPVEINLTSNLKILNLSGPNHPLHYYLSHAVPIVLSTDDEGILRTDLSNEYRQAVLDQNLDYPTLKQFNRNTLTYAFLPGKSIWANASKAELLPECKDLNSPACQDFIKTSEKARLQWELEQKLITFEKGYN